VLRRWSRKLGASMNVIVPIRNRMSEQEYEAERERLRATYGDSNVEAAAKRDQALAALFHRSGWTQEELARKEEKTQPWVVYRLRFGRFLNFITTVIKTESLPANLTERRFRALWEQTDKDAPKEEFRFRAVIKMLQSESVMAPRRPPIGAKIKERFADGKWHNLDVITEKIGADRDHVRETLDAIAKNQTYNCRAEKKRVGTGFAYRLFKLDRAIPSSELLEKLSPIVKGLEEQGRQSAAAASPQVVLVLAHQLRKLLDEWTQ
jgi:hypothetical protein